MKKSKYIILSLMLIIGCLCACSNKGEHNNDFEFITTEDNQSVKVDFDAEVLDCNHYENGVFYYTGYDNKIYTCGQAKKRGNHILCVADLDEGVQKPVCDKEDCKHSNAKCKAYICSEPESVCGMKATEEGIYFIKNNPFADINEGGVCVEKVSYDGVKREDLGYIFTYDLTKYSPEFNQITYFRMVDEHIYFRSALTDNESGKEKVVRLYKYNISGKEKAEVMYEKTVFVGSEQDIAWMVGAFNVYGKYLYHNFEGELQRINIDTFKSEKVTPDMYFVERYNNDGKILGYILNNENKEFYIYDDKKNYRSFLTDSGLDNDKIDIIRSTPFGVMEYYVDDKYIYIYERDRIEGTLIFDLDFKYIGTVEGKVTATIGDNLMCLVSGDFSLVTVKRDDILKTDRQVCTLIDNPKTSYNEWMESLQYK